MLAYQKWVILFSFFAIRFYYEVGEKYHHILLNLLLTAIFKLKVTEAWDSKFSTDLAAGKIFCMYMYVCIHDRDRNFYPIDTKFWKQVG